MEKKIRQWIESLDLFAIKSSAEMELRLHEFISERKGEGLDVSSYDTLDSLRLFLMKNHVSLRTNESKPKKIKSVYHASKICSSDDESRKVLHGFLINDKRDRIVSTDGRRLLVLPYSGSLPAGIWDIYNGKALKTLKFMTQEQYAAAMKDDTHPIHSTCVSRDYRDLTRADGHWFKKCEGEYPNYFSVIPEDKDLSAAGELTQEWFNGMKAALQLQKLVGTGRNSQQVGLELSAIQSTDAEGGEELQVVNITFDAGFLNDCFEILPQFSKGGRIRLECKKDGANVSPVVFSAKCGALYVLMPMRGDDPSANAPVAYAVNKMQPVPGAKPVAARPVKAAPVRAEVVKPEREDVVAEKPVVEVVDVSPPTGDAGDAPVARFTPGMPDDGHGDATVETDAPAGSKYAWKSLTPEERLINNLKFEQATYHKGIRRWESRLDFIHRLLDEGEEIRTETRVSKKKGKTHYLVNGNYLGKNAYEYASSLKGGGERMTA